MKRRTAFEPDNGNKQPSISEADSDDFQCKPFFYVSNCNDHHILQIVAIFLHFIIRGYWGKEMNWC